MDDELCVSAGISRKMARLFIVTCFIPLLHLYVAGHEMANTQKSSFIKRIILQHQLLHRGR